MTYFEHDHIRFHFRDIGGGLPLVFQHGLGSDVKQPLELFASPPPGCRMIAFDCRAHGLTEPIGLTERISIATYADDLGAFLNHLNIERAIVGGISMGAAVALNFALRYPGRSLGLIQCRPAWYIGLNWENAYIFLIIASLLRHFGPGCGKAYFRTTEIYREVERASPESAKSLLGQFDSDQCVARVPRIERIPFDAAARDVEELREIDVPVLVLANRQDPIHPFAYGESLAQTMRHAQFEEITPKSVNMKRHGDDIQCSVRRFLKCHFL